MFFNKRKIFKKSRLNNVIYINNINILIFNGYLSFKKLDLVYNLILPKKLNITLKGKFLYIDCLNCYKKEKFLIGTFSSLIYNIILGFNKNYIKKLLLVGVGYKSILIYNYLYLYLGFSHPILYKVPSDIDLSVSSFVEINISGYNKQRVYQIASIIRNFKKPDIYKGKGIRYLNEILKIKEIKKK